MGAATHSRSLGAYKGGAVRVCVHKCRKKVCELRGLCLAVGPWPCVQQAYRDTYLCYKGTSIKRSGHSGNARPPSPNYNKCRATPALSSCMIQKRCGNARRMFPIYREACRPEAGRSVECVLRRALAWSVCSQGRAGGMPACSKLGVAPLYTPIRNSAPLEPYRRHVPRALWGPRGVGDFL